MHTIRYLILAFCLLGISVYFAQSDKVINRSLIHHSPLKRVIAGRTIDVEPLVRWQAAKPNLAIVPRRPLTEQWEFLQINPQQYEADKRLLLATTGYGRTLAWVAVRNFPTNSPPGHSIFCLMYKVGGGSGHNVDGKLIKATLYDLGVPKP
jgi:hypothetical protein